MVIIKDRDMVCVIECKSNAVEINRHGRQFQGYKMLGLPFIYCLNSGDIDKTVVAVSQLIDKGGLSDDYKHLVEMPYSGFKGRLSLSNKKAKKMKPRKEEGFK